jgi:threonine dehydrogenase-like Zn-dependent dehydrogenase
VQHGLETHVVDPYATGSKPDLVRALGATFHREPVNDIGVAADVVLECAGLGQVAIDAVDTAAANAVIALVGISMGTHIVQTDANAINNALVMTNSAIFGSVNAARRHYEQAANALVMADPDWLDRLVTRRVTPDEWTTGLKKQPGDIKSLSICRRHRLSRSSFSVRRAKDLRRRGQGDVAAGHHDDRASDPTDPAGE